MSEALIIKTTDGEERETIRFDDGSWGCPFCGGANFPHPEGAERMWPYPCDNPACIAGGQGSLENVLAIRRRWADEAASKAARQRLEALAAQDRERQRQAAQAEQMAFRAESANSGCCFACWAHSTDFGRFPRLAVRVRHREPANCPQERKQAARAAR